MYQGKLILIFAGLENAFDRMLKAKVKLSETEKMLSKKLDKAQFDN